MTALPVAQYLRDLSGEQGSMAARGAAGRGVASPILEDRIEEAYVRGVLEGRAAAQAECEAQLQQQKEAAEEHLKSERARWAAEEGARLAADITKFLSDAEARISEQVARVLKPFVVEHIRAKAVSELQSSLAALLTNGEYKKISVSGPKDLVNALKSQLEGQTQAIQFAVVEGTYDVSITADETILETRIGAWIEAINGGCQ